MARHYAVVDPTERGSRRVLDRCEQVTNGDSIVESIRPALAAAVFRHHAAFSTVESILRFEQQLGLHIASTGATESSYDAAATNVDYSSLGYGCPDRPSWRDRFVQLLDGHTLPLHVIVVSHLVTDIILDADQMLRRADNMNVAFDPIPIDVRDDVADAREHGAAVRDNLPRSTLRSNRSSIALASNSSSQQNAMCSGRPPKRRTTAHMSQISHRRFLRLEFHLRRLLRLQSLRQLTKRVHSLGSSRCPPTVKPPKA